MAGKGVVLQSPPGAGCVVGIDLGTTMSVVAVCRREKVEIIANDNGSRMTPSVVALHGGESYVGEAAKELPSHCQVFDAKRLIGRPWNEVAMSADRKHWPFQVVENRGEAKVRLNVDGKTEEFSPEEISAMVLRSLKETAESVLQEKISKAVITVPAYFNERQRQATKLAGTLAGLEVVAMINEPTAAAIAYGLDKKVGTAQGKSTVFVYDLGGGTFDVSVMTIEGNQFTVLASGGDTHLGGRDFDVRLMDCLCEDIWNKHKLKLNMASVQELRKACELAKLKLSAAAEVPVHVFFSDQNLHYKTTISRACFNVLCLDLFKKTIAVANQVLRESKVSADAVDDVLLVGGSTRIPKVRELLQSMFGGKELRKAINPDEAVAFGAAVHAATLSGDSSFDKMVMLKDVTPLSLGIRVLGGRFAPVIPKNTPIPCEMTKEFFTSEDNQTIVGLGVYQGERPLVKDNHYLNKEVTLTVPRKRARKVKMDCTFKLDADGLLTVSAVERSTRAKQQVTISQDEARLSAEDINRMIANAARFHKPDLQEKERIERELKAQGFLL